jgi:hypothetical protein
LLFVQVFRNLTFAEITLQITLLFQKISANIRHFLHAVAGFIPHPGTKEINIPRSRGITVSQPLTERF